MAVLLVASLAGRAFQRLRLPRISGYLLTGAALGQALAVLGETHAARLAATDAMCLAVIGIAAGAELQLADLRRHPRPTLVMTACVSVFSFGFVFLAFLVVGPRVAFLKELGTAHVALVGSLLGTLAIARSPASAIAVLREMDARGPFCQHVMAVTVAKDALVVALFALNVEFAAGEPRLSPGSTAKETNVFAKERTFSRTRRRCRARCSRPRSPSPPRSRRASRWRRARPRGAAAGPLLRRRRRRGAAGAGNLTPPREAVAARGGGGTRGRWRVRARVARARRALLLCVVAGATCANRKHAGGAGERGTLRAATGWGVMPVNLVFFTAVGSSVRFDRVFADTNACLAAIALFAARLFALFHAAATARDALRFGAATAAAATPSFFHDPAVAEKIWLAMITQAGVAMGLVKSCERRFATTWGGDFAALAEATIVLNLLAGPPAFRHAIVAAGESGAQRAGGGGKGEPQKEPEKTRDDTGV